MYPLHEGRLLRLLGNTGGFGRGQVDHQFDGGGVVFLHKLTPVTLVLAQLSQKFPVIGWGSSARLYESFGVEIQWAERE